jgi:hypothetical protein
MADDGLSDADRRRVVGELDRVAYHLNATAAALERAGADAAACMVEAAAVQLAACCWVLSKAGMDVSAA